MANLISKTFPALAAIVLSLGLLATSFVPSIAAADEFIDPAAAGHGAARVMDTYKVFDCGLYKTDKYDVTYTIINYTSTYRHTYDSLISSWGSWSPTSGLGAYGTVSYYKCHYDCD